MDESKIGGPGPEETGIEPKLTPELEQEKKEIEARVDQHVAKLQEIAEVFGIDTNKFSDESDSIRKQNFDILQKNQEKHHQIVTVKGNSTLRVLSGELDIPSGDDIFSSLADLENKGNICHFWLRNFVHNLKHMDTMNGMDGSIMTADEQKAQSYYKVPGKGVSCMGLVHGISGDFAILRAKNLAQADPQIQNALKYLPIRQEDGSQYTQWENEIPDSSSYAKINRLKSIPTGMDRSFDDALILAARILSDLTIVNGQRLHYLISLARSGDPRFKRVGKGENYDISDDFQFTKEDARKAKELNLPWSRLEKEKK